MLLLPMLLSTFLTAQVIPLFGLELADESVLSVDLDHLCVSDNRRRLFPGVAAVKFSSEEDDRPCFGSGQFVLSEAKGSWAL